MSHSSSSICKATCISLDLVRKVDTEHRSLIIATQSRVRLRFRVRVRVKRRVRGREGSGSGSA